MMHIQGSLTIYVYITCIYIGRWPLTVRVTTTKVITEGSQPKPSFAIATRLPHLVYTYVKWKTFWLYIYIYSTYSFIFLHVWFMCFFFSDATCIPTTKNTGSTARKNPRIQSGGRSGILPRPCGSETWNWTWRKRGSVRWKAGFCFLVDALLKRGGWW